MKSLIIISALSLFCLASMSRVFSASPTLPKLTECSVEFPKIGGVGPQDKPIDDKSIYYISESKIINCPNSFVTVSGQVKNVHHLIGITNNDTTCIYSVPTFGRHTEANITCRAVLMPIITKRK